MRKIHERKEERSQNISGRRQSWNKTNRYGSLEVKWARSKARGSTPNFHLGLVLSLWGLFRELHERDRFGVDWVWGEESKMAGKKESLGRNKRTGFKENPTVGESVRGGRLKQIEGVKKNKVRYDKDWCLP